MTIQSGFFNSVSSDRTYQADDLNRLFEGVITEGVLTGHGDAFAVTSLSGMNVFVGSGRAWFLNTWSVQDTQDLLNISGANVTFDRIDVVALDVNKDAGTRNNSLVVIEGAPSGTPAVPNLTFTGTHNQYALAYVTVRAGTTDILQSDIEMRIGYAPTTICTGLLQQLDITGITDNWYDEFTQWMAGIESDINDISGGQVFDELDLVRGINYPRRNMVINGDFGIAQRYNVVGSSATGITGGATFPGISDMWGIQGSNAGTWTMSRGSQGPNLYSIRMECTTAKPTLDAASYMFVHQSIDGFQTAHANFGTLDSRPMTLSGWIKSNSNSGWHTIQLYDEVNNRTFTDGIDISTNDTWQKFELAVPAETSGSYWWPNGNARTLHLRLWMAAGSNYSGGSYPGGTTWEPYVAADQAVYQNNTADTVGDYVEYKDIQLEIGDSALPYQRDPVDLSLERVRRYFLFYDEFWFHGHAESATKLVSFDRMYPIRMRANPSISCTYGTVSPSGPTLDHASLSQFHGTYPDWKKDGHGFYITPDSNLVVGDNYQCILQNYMLDAYL